jgi:hypothetical protein
VGWPVTLVSFCISSEDTVPVVSVAPIQKAASDMLTDGMNTKQVGRSCLCFFQRTNTLARAPLVQNSQKNKEIDETSPESGNRVSAFSGFRCTGFRFHAAFRFSGFHR